MKMLIASVFFSLLTLSGCVANVSESALIRATPGMRLADGMSADGHWKIRAFDIQRPNDIALYSALFSQPNATALVLYFGGNVFAIDRHHQSVLSIYKNQAVDILLVDHRGYGGSTGVASIKSLIEDAPFVYDYARGLAEYRGKPIIVHGQSLGSFMAGNVAKMRTLDALVLEASATTTEDWIQGFVDNSVFIRGSIVQESLKGMGNLSVMATLDEPLLIVVGAKDVTTRSDMSTKLFAAANIAESQKELLIVPNAGHHDAARGASYVEAFTRLRAKVKVMPVVNALTP